MYVLGGSTLIVNLVGFVYPAYKSFKVRRVCHSALVLSAEANSHR